MLQAAQPLDATLFEEVVLVWMEGSDLSRTELLELLEKAFYRILELGVADTGRA